MVGIQKCGGYYGFTQANPGHSPSYNTRACHDFLDLFLSFESSLLLMVDF